MSKIICDVCGTSYPESANQCPICGCVRSSDSVTVEGDTNAPVVQPVSSYSHVKGGRFSKANVKKRNSGKPIYSSEAAPKTRKVKSDEPAANRAAAKPAVTHNATKPAAKKPGLKNVKKNEIILIATVVVLLIAIAAVVIYIAGSFLGMKSGDEQGNTTAGTTGTNATTEQTESSRETFESVPCTSLEVTPTTITLRAIGASQKITATAQPADTTDDVVFSSGDDEVASVDASGTVTAKGNGETVITILCGDFEQQCRVICELEDSQDPTENTNPPETTEPPESTEPSESVDPSVPDSSYTQEDLVFIDNGFRNEKGPEYSVPLSSGSYSPYIGNIPAELVTFSSGNEAVATVSADGKVTFVKTGTVEITAKYGDFEVVCTFRIY